MKKTLLAAFAALVLAQAGLAETDSLSRLFLPGRAVLDLDGDGFPEKPAVTILLSDKPTAGELALAADIAARVNFESLAVDFGLVRRESEIGGGATPPLPILIGGNLAWAREALKQRGLDPASLPANRGLVFLFTRKGQTGIACVAGSDEALLRTGRAFFLRWPYFWEIWGRETGATYESLEKDIGTFLAAAGVKLERSIVREALYEFPAAPPVSDGLKALALRPGSDQGPRRRAPFRRRSGPPQGPGSPAAPRLRPAARDEDRDPLRPGLRRPDLRAPLRPGALDGRPAENGRDQKTAHARLQRAARDRGRRPGVRSPRPLFEPGRLFGPGPGRRPRHPRGPGRGSQGALDPGHRRPRQPARPGNGRRLLPHRPARRRDREPQGHRRAPPRRRQRPDRRPSEDGQAQAPAARGRQRDHQDRPQGLRQINGPGRPGRRRPRSR